MKCARVGGVEIPNNKRIEVSLQYIHGIGRTRARKILNDLNVENKLTKDFSEEELVTLRDEVSKYMIEGDLVKFFSPLIYIVIFVFFKAFSLLGFWFCGSSEAFQCSGYKETEGNSVL